MRPLSLAVLVAFSLFALPASADDAAPESGADAAVGPSCSPDRAKSIASDGSAVSCAPYVCQPSSGLCAVSCVGTADCQAGFVCLSGSCKAAGATCSPDGKSSVTASGDTVSCAPYKCSSGMCLTSCATNDDCQAPMFCSTGSRSCVTTENPKASPDQSDGCAYGGRGAPAFGLALLGLSLAARARRRNG